jgi:hypothetical protein
MIAAARGCFWRTWSGFGTNFELRREVQSAARRDQVFISYSHKDKKWCDDLHTHLKPYLHGGSIVSWSDQQIRPGSQWFTEIKTALTNTKVAVLLVTPDFIASDFIHEYELGPLLKEAEEGGVRILWIPVRESAYMETTLQKYQAVIDPGKPLAGMSTANRDHAWATICGEIKKAVKVLSNIPDHQQHATESAKHWLSLIDAGKFAQSWKTAGEYFQTAVPQEEWQRSLNAVRKPLGDLVSRKLKSAKYTKSLPGAPDSEYVVLQLESSFANKEHAIETVTSMLGKDGQWRVSGYYIE